MNNTFGYIDPLFFVDDISKITNISKESLYKYNNNKVLEYGEKLKDPYYKDEVSPVLNRFTKSKDAKLTLYFHYFTEEIVIVDVVSDINVNSGMKFLFHIVDSKPVLIQERKLQYN